MDVKIIPENLADENTEPYSISNKSHERSTKPAQPMVCGIGTESSRFFILAPKVGEATSTCIQAAGSRSMHNRPLDSILAKPLKPKVFVNYHHKNVQGWYDRFSKLFAGKYGILTDTSIGRKIDSDDPIHQSRTTRENHISGNSITVVLIGHPHQGG